MNNTVIVITRTKKGYLLLRDGEIWRMPAGRNEENESARQVALKELTKLGATAKENELKLLFSQNKGKYILSVFLIQLGSILLGDSNTMYIQEISEIKDMPEFCPKQKPTLVEII